jgi:hypothetical protein
VIKIEVAPARRLWLWPWRRVWVLHVPEEWAEIPEKKRRRWWALAVLHGDRSALVRECLRPLPAPVRRLFSEEDRQAIAANLAWAVPAPNCENLVIDRVRIWLRIFRMPEPKGQNMTALEFAYCNDLYDKYVTSGDVEAATLLAATLWRPMRMWPSERRKAGDDRVGFFASAEAKARVNRMQPDMIVQALFYFAGFKDLLIKTYGAYLFDADEADESAASDEDQDEYANNEPTTPSGESDNYPDFGWWGIMQAVAEVGLFGNMEQVYQTSIHDLCIYLVRKEIENQRMKRNMPTKHA